MKPFYKNQPPAEGQTYRPNLCRASSSSFSSSFSSSSSSSSSSYSSSPSTLSSSPSLLVSSYLSSKLFRSSFYSILHLLHCLFVFFDISVSFSSVSSSSSCLSSSALSSLSFRPPAPFLSCAPCSIVRSKVKAPEVSRHRRVLFYFIFRPSKTWCLQFLSEP